MYLYPEHCTKNMYKCTFFLHMLCPVHFKLWQLIGLKCSGHKNMSNCQEKNTLFSVTTACTLMKVGKLFFTYSVSINFRLELIMPTAREVFIFWTLVEREERRASEERRRNMA